jgi:hypothetical protein
MPGPCGLLPRAVSAPHLLSGFLKCGLCGANLTIVAGRGTRQGRIKEYGCSHHHNRGICTNSLRVRLDLVEGILLEQLQKEVLKPAAVDYVVESVARTLRSETDAAQTERLTQQKRRKALQAEIKKLAAAIAASGHSAALLALLAEKERALQELGRPQAAATPDLDAARLRQFILARMQQLPCLLRGDVERARAELPRHLEPVRMLPKEQEGERFYVAESKWDLLAGDPVINQSIAGAGFEPATFGL